ncbi:type II/IV secretion system protein [Candidatus Saccharibacteria bacterium]|nr:type II/IV secretion system protein [Candidatus Saccharibacteria bacterium]
MILSAAIEHKIEQIIAQQGILAPQQLEQAKIDALQQSKSLLQLLVERGTVKEDDATKLVAMSSNLPFVDLSSITIPKDILALIPRDVAESFSSVAFGVVDGKLNVATLDPQNLQAIDFLSRKTSYPINAYMASKTQIDKWLNSYSTDISEEVGEALVGDEESDAQTTADELKNLGKAGSKKIETIVQDAPITRALNTIFEYAINSMASDIHIEPREKSVNIRFRIDGILQEVMSLPKTTEAALVSRIKILSNLKIDEHRIPQDGQSQYRTGGKTVDMRIAIAPITYGEQIVIRLLDKSEGIFDIDSLGFKGRSAKILRKAISRPHGMILSTGPTGSGKSTTLYAIIQTIKSGKINIVTLEDPVEYKMDGINQMQVNNAIGLTFANGLRSILRQDPNVIMVGEIRDHETADLAVQSSLTGHLVLSTLHTNAAAGVLPRLLDMGIEPFLIASTINVVMGQRLVRKVCEKCRQPMQATQAAVDMINRLVGDFLAKDQQQTKVVEEALGYKGLPIYSQNAYTLYKGEGCSNCDEGYKGRIGIYEIFEMNKDIEQLLLKEATTSTIQAQAQRDGMLTMQQDGILKALSGVTTIEEVSRVSADI